MPKTMAEIETLNQRARDWQAPVPEDERPSRQELEAENRELRKKLDEIQNERWHLSRLGSTRRPPVTDVGFDILSADYHLRFRYPPPHDLTVPVPKELARDPHALGRLRETFAEKWAEHARRSFDEAISVLPEFRSDLDPAKTGE